MKNSIHLFRSFLLAGMLMIGMMAQAKVVSGTVTDQTGETIISASVVVKGTTNGTVTDFDGNYTLDVPDNAILVFSYIGLVSQEIPVNGQSVINVVLKENAEVLEEVVVTGYGTTKKRDLVTAVASVGADQINDIPVTTAAEALQGKLAGVSVTTTEGSPDADVKIRVRGGTSLTQSSDPLYIVDGFQVSSIADIAPSDIQSMDVLKDAAATAIYGAQGANGVIIITTKDVKIEDDKMQCHVDYSGYMGWKKSTAHYDMQDYKSFILMQKEWAHVAKNGQEDNYFYKYFDPVGQVVGENSPLEDIFSYWKGTETDWQDKTFGLTGMNSNHTFTVTGGNKMATFGLTYNRIDDKGILYGSNYARNNLSFKTKFQPIKNLTIAVTARYSNTQVLGSGTNTAEDKGSTSESRIRNAVAYTPIPISTSSASDLAEDEESIGSLYDPITTLNDNHRVKKDNKWTIDGYVQYKFAKYFTVKAVLGYESRDVSQDRFYGPTTYFSRSSVSAYTAAKRGNAVSTTDKTSRLTHTGSLNYKQTFDNVHSLDVFVAEEVLIRRGELRTQYCYGFDPKWSGSQVFDHLAAADRYVSSNYIYPNDNMLSFIGRLDYNYKGKYYATLTFRADCSTKFSKGHQWGYFPSGALAWRIIDEEWMEPAQEVMSNFKLRATYGLVGNNNIELGYIHPEYLATAASNSGMYNTQYNIGAGGTKNVLIAPNENLKWETTTSRNLGLDFGFWNERLSGSIDGYCNSTKDLLLLYRLPSGGYNYQYRNIGATQNMGIEVSVNAVLLTNKNKDLNYNLTLGANVSHNNTIVKSLGGMDSYKVSAECFSNKYANNDYEYMLVPGGRVGNIYGYKTNGVYTTADFDGYDDKNHAFTKDGKAISTPMGNARPGMAKIVMDPNTEDGRTILGNTQPVVTGGFNLGFNIGGEKWGKIDLAANFTFSVGNKILNLSAMDYENITESSRLRNMSAGVNNHYTYLDASGAYISPVQAWDQFVSKMDERNSNATEACPIVDNMALTDRYVEDGSYLRLSSLNIGYTIPQSALKAAHMTTLRVFFSASNLFCATKYSGADPEVDCRSKNNPLATGVDFSAFPKNRAFNFGLSVGF